MIESKGGRRTMTEIYLVLVWADSGLPEQQNVHMCR